MPEIISDRSNVTWDSQFSSYDLMLGEVHVWCIPIGLPGSIMAQFYLLLSNDEKERAQRFFFQRDRERFVAGRGVLRTLLGRYTRVRPEALHFSYSEYGKPFLEAQENFENITFNISHSRDLALLGVARGRAIGVDIECSRPDVLDEDIAERFFSPHEVAALHSLPRRQQEKAFFNCWTRKEAYLKARGEGLGFPLDQFSVSLAPGDPPALLSSSTDSLECEDWSLFDLPISGYAAALAIAGKPVSLQCRQWIQ